jgi:hypothetical protein
MAGTNTLTSRVRREFGKAERRGVEIVTVDWVADASAATVPNLTITLDGYLVKVVTNPGSTAPTDLYDITLGDPEDSNLDAAGGLLANRATTTTQQVYTLVSGASSPLLLAGDYTLAISNNAVNSASGRIIFYLTDGT